MSDPADDRPRPPDSDLDKLAETVSELRYDALQVFLARLAERLKDDACDDWDRGRTQLASRLDLTGASVRDAAESAEKLWKICRLHTICTARDSGGARCELRLGHASNHACPAARNSRGR